MIEMKKRKSIANTFIAAMDENPEEFEFSDIHRRITHKKSDYCIHIPPWFSDSVMGLEAPFAHDFSFFERYRIRKAIKRFKQWIIAHDLTPFSS